MKPLAIRFQLTSPVRSDLLFPPRPGALTVFRGEIVSSSLRCVLPSVFRSDHNERRNLSYSFPPSHVAP